MGKPDTLGDDASEHERALFKCRMAENAERFDDMVSFIRKACESSTEPLGPNERNYLSVAYKNSVGARRNALRCLTAMKHKYEQKEASINVKIIDDYYAAVLEELVGICNEVLNLIDKQILRPEVLNDLKDDLSAREFKVFFHKMYADYYRYLSEFATGGDKTVAIQKASENYKKAMESASQGLPPSHPIRLGLCLNYSVFLYEIEDQPKEAKELAKKAFDEALDNLDSAGELEYKDSTLILQLLRDNTTLWCSQDNDSNTGAPAAPQPGPADQKPAAP
ncbi:14-3-3 family protein [Gregarina niphandrodes]|uniref:14-3-3 family protein n=1 Tax=Gregarina niphandrodes TaxID=110365 RepID=A0A023B1Q6_GRENI|nr:14-3-3 family protein [Gregarina niphandrodes]EZG46380.1 14-3-3 family protein [Gregarina niphandrodes]|eukprot:XP_011132308.1 14-3-3 family protein [Gregarina niphandrodes]